MTVKKWPLDNHHILLSSALPSSLPVTGTIQAECLTTSHTCILGRSRHGTIPTTTAVHHKYMYWPLKRCFRKYVRSATEVEYLDSLKRRLKSQVLCLGRLRVILCRLLCASEVIQILSDPCSVGNIFVVFDNCRSLVGQVTFLAERYVNQPRWLLSETLHTI